MHVDLPNGMASFIDAIPSHRFICVELELSIEYGLMFVLQYILSDACSHH